MGAGEIAIRWAAGPQDVDGALAVREEVFCREQGVPRSDEIDGMDGGALHLVAVESAGGRVIATLRLVLADRRARIGRVAVEREWRRRGVASRMMEMALELARERGCQQARLAAQTGATGLYERAGFSVESGPFQSAGIEHVWMGRTLDERDAGHVQEVVIPFARGVSLGGELRVPERPRGIVVFAHGSGSSRRSPRNRAVAQSLEQAGYATLLFDLLTRGEESDRANVFDIPLLASRLLAASDWLRGRPGVAELPLAYFGASTGAAAALEAAAKLGEEVRAVISRGGRPDLARSLGAVRAPTLLIVGGADEQVLELNRAAQRQLLAPSELAVVPGATHLFSEPGALEQVSRLAIEWLDRYLA